MDNKTDQTNNQARESNDVIPKTPRAHSLPRQIGKRPLSSPDDAERGPFKSHKSEDLMGVLCEMQKAISNIQLDQSTILQKLSKLDNIEESVHSLTKKVLEVEKDFKSEIEGIRTPNKQ